MATAAELERHADALRAADPRAAIAAYRAALAAAPERTSARFGLAEAWRAAREPERALPLLQALVRDFPRAWQAHNDLGNVLRDLGRFAEAEAAYRAALACAETPVALAHLGAVLRDMGRLAEAERVLARALALDPGHADARYTLAITRFSAGRWAEGWADYESRFKKFGDPVDPRRHWLSGPPGARTILVRAEQGLGDTIQFARYVPVLAEAGARVALQVQPPLLRLFAALPGCAHLSALGAPPPPHARHVRLMSLPHRLGADGPVPPAAPYLRAPGAEAAGWAARLAALPGRKVGLAWAGSPDFPADRRRSIPPEELAPLAAVPGATLVSLQVPPRPHGLDLFDATADLNDLAATAALIAALDLVIAADTAVAHLAGALGRPVWLLNRFDGCWRWQTEGATSCWYPTMRLFRQPAPGDWSSPIAAAAASLRAFADAG